MLEKDYRFNLEEFAGAIGDYGTLLPIILGVALVVNINLSAVFFFFALSYIFTGLYYKLPMPVEPMKAVGAIAIAGGLSVNEIAATGIILGLILILLGYFDIVRKIKELIPTWLVRGIQFGLALILIRTSFNYLLNDPIISLISVFIIAGFYFLSVKDLSALVVFLFGLIIGIVNYGFPEITLFNLPSIILPSFIDFKNALINGALPQLPLSLGNAILATSLLISDLLDRNVSEKKLAYSMGIMCLVSAPFGGFPMCHGAGGLAAQYRFGARTGGSNIISGVILLIVALFFASPNFINIIPLGVLGAMIFFSSTQMMQSAIKTDNILLMLITGVLSFVFNIAIAVTIMLVLDFIMKNKTIFKNSDKI